MAGLSTPRSLFKRCLPQAVLLLASVFISVLSFASGGVPDDVAVIVNKENPVNGLTSKDLSGILRQDKQFWENGRKIYLLMRESGATEKKVILRKIYQMDDEELKRFWLSKMFTGDISSFPKTLHSTEAVKRFVAEDPDAVGFIDATYVDDSVKVLPIDGRLPQEKNYLLVED